MKTPSLLWRVLLLSAVVSTAVALSGCSFTVHERTVPSGASTTGAPSTVGQELIDLKRAYDGGAISQTEYEAKKNELLSRPR